MGATRGPCPHPLDYPAGSFASSRMSENDCVLRIRVPGMSRFDSNLPLTQINHPDPVIYVATNHNGGSREASLFRESAALLAKTFDDEHLLSTIHLLNSLSGRSRAVDMTPPVSSCMMRLYEGPVARRNHSGLR